MFLSLKHVILESGAPEHTLAELCERLAVPALQPVRDCFGARVGVVHLGSVLLAVVRFAGDVPPAPRAYGLGFTADVPIERAAADLRARGLATSPVVALEADGRRTSFVAVGGLLGEPFETSASSRPVGFRDRLLGAAMGRAARVDALARLLGRRSGRSLVVLTQAPPRPVSWRVNAQAPLMVDTVEVGTGGIDWARLGAIDGPPRLAPDPVFGPQVVFRHDEPPGVKSIRIVARRESFTIGDLAVTFGD